MRSTVAFLLCIAVAQLSWLTVDAFSLLQATRAVSPTKATRAVAPAKKAVPKTAIKVSQKSQRKENAKKKSVQPSKAKVVTEAKAKAELKARQKAKANTVLQAKRKAVAQVNAKRAAVAKAKALADAKKVAAAKAKRARQKAKTTTSETARNVLKSGNDASLAITKNVKPKKGTPNKKRFPGLQASGKKPLKKTFNAPLAKAKPVVAKKAPDALNPLEFGLQVAQSEKGQEAAATLVEGGLKLVEAILAEGKKTKVAIPRGFNKGTGTLKKPIIANIGYKQLLDAGIFAGTELVDVAKSNYDKFYVGSDIKQQVRITQTAAGKENYVVKVNGKSVMVSRPLR